MCGGGGVLGGKLRPDFEGRLGSERGLGRGVCV